MSSISFINLVTVVMALLVMLMMAVTVSAKAVRYLRASWYERHYKRIEPALEKSILTGENQPELLQLPPWQRDLFLSRLIVERIALLRGSGQEFLMRLAADLGLVDEYLKTLESRRRWRRARAGQSLGYFGGERAVEPLGKLLSDEDETIRAVAARALARIGSDEAVRLLVRTLDDPSELTRLRVAENLERLGQSAIGPLVDSLEDTVTLDAERSHGQITAVRVLGNLRAAGARGVLRRVACDGKEVDLRAQAMLALGRIGDPEDVPVLLEGTKDGSWPVRAQAANALGMVGEVSTIPTLKDLAADEEWWVRLNACKALANMGPEGEKALLELLQGDDRYARDRAAATLEIQGITRRMVRQLAKPGKRGERARTIVGAAIRSGATKYLGGLAEALPEGEERRILREMLGAAETVNGRPVGAEAEQMEPIGAEPKAEREDAESVKVEPTSAEPLAAGSADVEPRRPELEEQRPHGPQVGGR